MEVKLEYQSVCYFIGVKDGKISFIVKKVLQGLFCYENFVVLVFKMDFERNKNVWNVLNLLYNYCLLFLNDESLLGVIFEEFGLVDVGLSGINYKFGF